MDCMEDDVFSQAFRWIEWNKCDQMLALGIAKFPQS